MDLAEASSTKGEPKSLSGRVNSTPPSGSSYYNSPSASRNRLNSTLSILSRTTVDTALTTRPSINSISPMAARKKTGTLSTLSIGSIPSPAIVLHCNRKTIANSTSGRSLATTDSFGNSTRDSIIPNSPDITWTPPPHHSEFGGSDEENNNRNGNRICANNDANIQAPSRLNSILSMKSTPSKQYPPTREELEQAAFTLMAAQEHGLTEGCGPIYHDIFQDLASSDRNLNGDESNKRRFGRDSPCSQSDNSIPMNRNGIQDNESIGDYYDDDMNSKSKSENNASLNSSLIESDQPLDTDLKHSSRLKRIQNDDLEQNSTIIESNPSFPKSVSVADEDDQIVSLYSNQPSQNQRKKGALNRGGAFQPRLTHGHGRPGVGTQVFAGSTRTMSSMSSIGEEDHSLVQNSLDQKPSQALHGRRNLIRMGSLSRNRQGSSHTLGSLSTIEAINEEDTSRMQSAVDNLSAGSLSVDHNSDNMLATSFRSGEDTENDEVVHSNEKEKAYSDRERERWSLDLPTRENGLDGQSVSTHLNQGKEVGNQLYDQLIFLRESSKSPEKTRKALEILSECGTLGNDEEVDTYGMEIIVDYMKTHIDTCDIQILGCRAILNLSSSRAQVQNIFIQAGAPDVIRQAMKRYLKRGEEFLEQAIATLSILSFNHLSADSLVGKGEDAIEAIVTAMGYYPGHTGIQRKGCEALATLATHGDSIRRLRIMDKEAGNAIVFNAMAMHSEDFVVQKWALSAVRNLCLDCEENQTEFLELGVVDPILTAMKKHRIVAGLQEAGAGAISILAGNNVETKKVIEENGGIVLILRAILDHSNVSKERCSYVRGLMTLALDSYNGNNPESRTSKDNIKASGVIDAVLNAIDAPQEESKRSKLSLAIDAVIIAMETHEDNSAVQEIGCAVLCGLADLIDDDITTNADQTKMDIVDEGALDAINMAMVLHKHDAHVQERACMLLLCLAIEENYAAILAAIGTHLLEDAAKDFPGRCQELANKLIQMLDDYEQNEDGHRE